MSDGRYVRFLDTEGWDCMGGMDVKKTRSMLALVYHLSSHIIYMPHRQQDGWQNCSDLYQNIVKGMQDFSNAATVESNLRNFPTLHVLAFEFDGELKVSNASEGGHMENISQSQSDETSPCKRTAHS